MIKILYTLLLLTVIALGNEKPTLTIYTYDAFSVSWGPGPKIKKVFEKEHHCNVKFVGMSSSIGALRKIQLEGKNTKADILLGLDTNIAQAANETGLFAAHGLDTSHLDLPIAYEDSNFVPYDYSYIAFVYDTNRLQTPPDSFEALAAMPEDFKIIIQDPRSSTPGLSLLLWVKEIYKEKAGEYWKKLAPHILTITKGWSESYGLFLKGEADMVLSRQIWCSPIRLHLPITSSMKIEPTSRVQASKRGIMERSKLQPCSTLLNIKIWQKSSYVFCIVKHLQRSSLLQTGHTLSLKQNRVYLKLSRH